MSNLVLEKKALRSSVISSRDALPAREREQASERVCEDISSMTPYLRASSILAFASFGSELNTQSLLRRVISDGKNLILPRVNKATQQLQLHRIKALNALIPGIWGILEPHADAIVFDLADIELIIVPGVAFDRAGFRIGYGKGFYDKLLSAANPATTRLSAAFDCQIVDAVPNDAHDERVDLIITPTQKILISHDR